MLFSSGAGGTTRHFVVKFDFVEDAYYKRIPHMRLHKMRIELEAKEGKLRFLGAPYFPFEGGVLLLETQQDKEYVERFIEDDPYVKKGII